MRQRQVQACQDVLDRLQHAVDKSLTLQQPKANREVRQAGGDFCSCRGCLDVRSCVAMLLVCRCMAQLGKGFIRHSLIPRAVVTGEGCATPRPSSPPSTARGTCLQSLTPLGHQLSQGQVGAHHVLVADLQLAGCIQLASSRVPAEAAAGGSGPPLQAMRCWQCANGQCSASAAGQPGRTALPAPA